ncbi:MAG TPA: hypothetical protein VFB62_10020, partial [Polyangiaceae bacterium]|nr:hypothetical protein [Polyangiaceae bacterium]
MLFVGARTARAESEAVNRCLAATEQGQLARQKAEYRAAREHFRVCAGESCPEAVSKDCARWLDELDRAQPTVLLS